MKKTIRKMSLILPLLLMPLAGQATTSIYNGDDLLTFCQHPDEDVHAACFGYIVGVVDTMSSVKSTAGTFCPPSDVGPSFFTGMVRKFMLRHPEFLHKDASFVVGLALLSNLPCEDE